MRRRAGLRRTGGLLLLTAVVGLVVTGWNGRRHAVAADAPTAALGSFSLTATAPGYEITEDEPAAQAHPEGHGAIGYTSALLSSGPVGYGLSTVAWPGATFANAGGLIDVLFPAQVPSTDIPIPDGVKQAVSPFIPLANYPIRAEARTGTQPDGKFDAPGTTLTAHADDAKVDALAAVNGAQQPEGATYGNTKSQSTTALVNNGAKAQATATSVVQNITIGVIKIGSVTSTADAVTDGKTATAKGQTVVHDMTIGGQRAYFDETGVHIGDAGQPANAVADQIANQAVAGMGAKMYTSAPRLEKNGASATYTAGSLIVVWHPPSNPSENEFVTTFGGARVSVTSTPGFGTPASAGPEQPAAAAPASPAVESATAETSAPAESSTPSVESAAAPTASDAPLQAAGPAVSESSTVVNALRPTSSTRRGIPASWVVLGLLGAGLMGAGSRRVTDDVLERAATACPLESQR